VPGNAPSVRQLGVEDTGGRADDFSWVEDARGGVDARPRV